MRWFRVSTLAVVLLCGGCLLCGCLSDDVRSAFGFSNPTLEASYHPLWGVKFKAGSNFTGDVHAEWDADSNAFLVEAGVSSDVSGVLNAEAARITENFLAGRKLEYEHKIRQAEIVGENFIAFGNMGALLFNALGEQAIPIIQTMAETARGSNITVDVPGLGGGAVNLGNCPNKE